MKENNKTRKLFCIAVYAIFAVFYAWLAAQIPYTHDDWDWGLDVGINQWLSASINSRYVGNFFEVIMARSEILKTVIMGAGFFLLPFIASGIAFSKTEANTHNGRVIGFVLCNVLILSMHRTIWQQTYGWVAGYANFGISAIFLLIVLKQFLHVFDDLSSQRNVFRPRTIVLFLVCLASQLFIENIAIYLFLFSVLVNFIYWYRTKRFSWEYMAMLLAALIGLVLMFSSNIYSSLWSTGEALGYRRLRVNSKTNIMAVIVGCIYQMIELPYYLYAKNFPICITILILMTVLVLQKKSGEILSKILCCVVNCIAIVCLVLSHLLVDGYLIISVAFFVIVSIELIILFRREKRRLGRLLFVWVSPICIILPIVFTNEMGARLFFSTNSVLILFAILMLRFSFSFTSTKKKVCCAVLVCTLACALLFQYGTIYYSIGECKEQREKIIESALKTGADTIYLPEYPYPEYLWEPNPKEPKREVFFKEFYNIPQDVSIVFGE